MTLDYWYVSHSMKCQYSIVKAYLFCHKFKPFQMLYFVNNCSNIRMTQLWSVYTEHERDRERERAVFRPGIV